MLLAKHLELTLKASGSVGARSAFARSVFARSELAEACVYAEWAREACGLERELKDAVILNAER